MPVLNLGLQHTAFERKAMASEYEALFKSDSSMKAIRKRIDGLDGKEADDARDAWKGSISPVLDELRARWSRLVFAEREIMMAPTATDDEIKEMQQLVVDRVDPDWNADLTTKGRARGRGRGRGN